MTDTIHATDSDGARCGAFGATFDGDASEGSGEAVVDANTAPLDGGMGVEARVRAVVAAFAGIDAEGVTPAERVACVAALEAVKG
ncbi:hypothetical protein, partial [Knoellia subterranea]|uniref:hypothetical protein n=1 Tax=Knoellia subterranea TaxID=184882 RepID=UPI00055D4B78